MKKKIITVITFATLCFMLLNTNLSKGADVNSITTGKNANGAYEIQISGTSLSKPSSYSLNSPARIVVDIPNAKSTLRKKVFNVNNQVVNSVAVIEGDDRVRATINLSRPSPYIVLNTKSKISIVVKNQRKPIQRKKSQKQRHTAKNKQTATKRRKISVGTASVNFKRGSEGQGKILIKLPNSRASVNIDKVGRKVVARIKGARFSQSRQLNVTDFGTPAKTVDIYKNRAEVSAINDQFEVISYQNDKTFTIELLRPSLNKKNQDLLPAGHPNKEYTGKNLSLNFQDIEVRAVLQLIGDFTNTNIVVSDEVSGNVTLRLNNVPWDQALDTILQMEGLSMRKNGNIIFIASSQTIAKNIRDGNAVSTVEQESAPLQQQLIQIKYARAGSIQSILKNESKGGNGVLSARGSLNIDPRTNTLIVNDVPSNIDKVRELVNLLDVAVKQVLIDARIVSASDTFTHELGVRWGGISVKGRTITSGSLQAADTVRAITGDDDKLPAISDRLGVNLGVAGAAGRLGLQILGGDFLLDMELSALQADGRGEVISSPRVITQDGQRASIKQGVEIPYQTQAGQGSPTIQFKQANLQLDVTPKIAPNDMIDMILTINKDTRGSDVATATGTVPSINTNEVKTKVLIENGETVVLGGVYEQTKNKTQTKVPLLGDIPLIGRAFRKDANSISKRELLIFVTPRIIDQRYISNDKFSELRQ